MPDDGSIFIVLTIDSLLFKFQLKLEMKMNRFNGTIFYSFYLKF